MYNIQHINCTSFAIMIIDYAIEKLFLRTNQSNEMKYGKEIIIEV
jgi:hypothetical protein